MGLFLAQFGRKLANFYHTILNILQLCVFDIKNLSY